MVSLSHSQRKLSSQEASQEGTSSFRILNSSVTAVLQIQVILGNRFAYSRKKK